MTQFEYLQSNFGTVSAMKEGMVVVTAADKKNTAHFDNAEVRTGVLSNKG